MRPTAVLFDAGGTLVHMSPERAGDIVEPFAGARPDPDRMIGAHYVAMHALSARPDIATAPQREMWSFWVRTFLDAGCGVEKRIRRRNGTIANVMVGEAAGTIPDADDLAESRLRGRGRFQTVILGIGQGPLTWTPLQAANAYATVARGDVRRDATLVPEAPHRAPAGETATNNRRLPSRTR